MIRLTGVSKRFAHTVALHPLDLSFDDAQTTVLIGPSGCGKTTILKLIIGLLEPTTGKLEFDGLEIRANTLMEVRRRIGYVIQEGGLFPHLTARQNILLMPRHWGYPDADSQKRLLELCELTRLPIDSLSHYPAELSGGQRQRVGLIRGLMLKPDALLLDEPLAALDPMVRAALQTELKAIFKHLRQTVVMVTHELAEAATLGDKIVLLRDGRIVQQGSFAELQNHPADKFVTDFINAQRNLFLT